VENIIAEAMELTGRGVKELILVAQDTTRYGLDLYGELSLKRLLVELCKIDELKWIRLHYMYPDEITDELIETIVKNEKILNYLDIPIQHINDGILQRMNRRVVDEGIRALIRKLRERIPEVVIRTSIIAGLPGEGEEEFEELCEFLREARIERAGVFTYSPEEGTPAALMERPDDDVASMRADILSGIQSQVIDSFNESRLGKVTTVLVEKNEEERYYGRSFAESPDVDGYIALVGDEIKEYEFAEIRIIDIIDGEPLGSLVEK